MEIGNEFKAKYINPFTDFGFKKLFGTEANKELLIEFLKVLIQKEGKIVDLKYLSNEQLGRSEIDRKAVFDIYCETESGEKFIVEMQKAKQNYFKDRSIFYSSFPIQEQAKRGNDWNFKLSPVYTIGILDFVFDEDKYDPEKYVYCIQLADNETHKIFYNKLTFIYLELPKFNKTEDELETLFDKWMYVLKNLSKLQDRPKALQERVFKKLFQIAAIEKLDHKERQAYESSLKYYWDMKNVIDTAVDEAIKEKDEKLKEKDEIIKEKDETIKEKDETIVRTINNLLAMGLSPDQIAKATGVSIDRIVKIKKV